MGDQSVLSEDYRAGTKPTGDEVAVENSKEMGAATR